jgi:hypothetical protein
MMERKNALICLCAAALLVTACEPRETPRWAPNVERTDITPSEWMVGCFAIEPMTDRLRAAGSGNEIELTDRQGDVVEGRQWYRAKANGAHLNYGRWSPIAASKIRVQIASEGYGSLAYVLSRSDGGFVGTYEEIGDVASAEPPDIPVSLRKVDCGSATAK